MPDIEDFVRPHPIDIPSMPRAQRKRVLWGLVAVAAILFIGGMAVAFAQRHHTICTDKQPPIAQKMLDIGQMVYQCQNGELVTVGG
jgi:hypothetical protein